MLIKSLLRVGMKKFLTGPVYEHVNNVENVNLHNGE